MFANEYFLYRIAFKPHLYFCKIGGKASVFCTKRNVDEKLYLSYDFLHSQSTESKNLRIRTVFFLFFLSQIAFKAVFIFW